MTEEEKKTNEEEKVAEDDVQRLFNQTMDQKHAIDRMVLEMKELETILEDERHEFMRKQVGLSTLVTVLMDARFGAGGDVFIGRDEFVRLATESAAAREDITMLQKELDSAHDELRILRSSTITHRMALQESTGLKLAELIAQRDNLKQALLKTASTDNTEETKKWIEDIMANGIPKGTL